MGFDSNFLGHHLTVPKMFDNCDHQLRLKITWNDPSHVASDLHEATSRHHIRLRNDLRLILDDWIAVNQLQLGSNLSYHFTMQKLLAHVYLSDWVIDEIISFSGDVLSLKLGCYDGDHRATCLCAATSLTRLLRCLQFAFHSICCLVVSYSDFLQKLWCSLIWRSRRLNFACLDQLDYGPFLAEIRTGYATADAINCALTNDTTIDTLLKAYAYCYFPE